MQSENTIIMININDIVPGKYQLRKVFDEEGIKELALSIKAYGILNPLLVRKTSSKYEIIAGERRYRAAKMLNMQEIPVIIKDISDGEMAELALIENIQRKSLNPVEEAKSYKEILNLQNITQEDLSKKIGKSQSSISNKMRLLSLSEKVIDALFNNQISEKHARTLLKLESSEDQNKLLEEIINNKLSVKETEQIINTKISKNNIKDVLNSLDINNTSSDIFNDIELEIKEKGDKKMNNNMGNFFPQIDKNNQNNINIDNQNPIMFNNTPIGPTAVTPPMPETPQMTNTVPLNTLNQEPQINTLSSMNMTPSNGLNLAETSPINLGEQQVGSQTSLNEPIITENNTIVSPTPTVDTQVPPTMPDPPLFTAPVDMPSQEVSIPVNEETTIPMEQKNSSIEKIKEALSNLKDEKVTFKEYNNDTETCIIISIEK